MRPAPSDFSDQQRRWLMDLVNTLDREIRISTVGVYYTGAPVAGLAATPSTIAWDGDLLPNQYMHSTTTNPSRLMAPEDGYYEIYCNAWVDAAGATTHTLAISVNGAAVCNIDANYVAVAGKFMLKGYHVLSLSRDDYITVQVSSTLAYNYYGHATQARCTCAFMRLLPR